MKWFIVTLLYLLLVGYICVAEKIRYISTEHPATTYFNPKYLAYVNLTSKRYGRNDPFYYVGLHLHSLWMTPNNVSVDFVFYEWLTNQYKRGFVEMHYKICDLIHKDTFFGTALKQGKLLQPCPFPPGVYHLYNMTVPVKYVPSNFPFQKGRIYCNATSTDNNDQVLSGYNIDMEIKEYNTKTRKSNKIPFLTLSNP